MPSVFPFPKISAADAASLIQHGSVIGFGGFTPAGVPKAIPQALAARASEEHRQGRPFQVGVISGSSTGDSVDGALTRAEAISFRAPYQANADLRRAINAGKTRFVDMDLSQVPRAVRSGWFGKLSWAIVEASAITPAGEIVLTSGVGAAQTYCRVADKILIEINARHPPSLLGLHDILELPDAPHAREIQIFNTADRVGLSVVTIDKSKVCGVVETALDDEMYPFEEPDSLNLQIGAHVADFLAAEMKRGAIPSSFLPLQSGVGDVANGVLLALGSNQAIPPFTIYAEVIQSAVLQLMRAGKVRFASGSALTVMANVLAEVYSELAFFKPRLILRPQEISNSPEVIRRLGVIAINTALEADVFGNVNSTHVLGDSIVNGLGGSGDFARNASLSIFTTPSTAKNGCISRIVPLVSHVDHTEHCVNVIVTEHGVADLRGKSPRERASAIIERCAHPDYKPLLREYLKLSNKGQTPQSLCSAFSFHQKFIDCGDMRK
jgi:acetyl-CoA hydrolase